MHYNEKKDNESFADVIIWLSKRGKLKDTVLTT